MKIGDYVMTPLGPGVLVAIDLPGDNNARWGVCFTAASVPNIDIWGIRHPPSLYFWPHEVRRISTSPINWVETTEEDYWEMLCVLPPEDRHKGGFLVGEPGDHCTDTGVPRFQAYRETPDGRFLRSNRCLSRAEFRAEMEKGVTHA